MDDDTRQRLREVHDSAVDAILELVTGLDEDDDEGLERIHEDALALEVRPGWHPPGEIPDGPESYRILLTTGGPAVRIVGLLDEHGEPQTAGIECQDWFLPWTSFPTTSEEDAALLRYASCFWFGT